ncbi:MAG: hypothetical protein AB8G86_13180 [Saprospiraceae bacterium]
MYNACLKYIIICCFLSACFSTKLLANSKDSLKVMEATDETTTTIFKVLKSQQIQEVTIQTNIGQIMEGKRTIDNFPATLIFTDKAGNILKKSIELTPRGKSRRNYCDFPPLRVKFSKEQLLERGIRKDHKSLKLVTHCNEGLMANHNVLKEFLAYKIYHELTDNSLDVQLLKVNYEDTQSDTKLEKYAILLEDIDEFAESINGKEIEGYGKTWKDFEKENGNTLALFQYMIGNEDWDILNYRNIKYIQLKDTKTIIAVPYDFDSSGFVSTAYAKPDPNLKMQSVKQRFFMGKFNNKSAREATIDLFKSKEKTVYQLVDEFELLEEISKLELKEYVDSFYKTIHSPKLIERAFPVKRKRAEKSDLEGEMHF